MQLSDITANPNNPRLIKDDKFKKLCQSIKDFPKMMELRPIVVDSDNVILGGNMRYKALKELKYKEVPDSWVKQADSLTYDEKRRFIIEDNVGFGEWNWETLSQDWGAQELQDWGMELPVGFGDSLEAEEDDYEIPDTIETDIVLGDLFEIGEHRLLCGDCSDSDAVANLMGGGAMADLYITDPPYGVSYVGKTKDALTIQNDKLSKDGTHELWRDAFNTALIFLKDGASIYATVPPGLLQLGFMQVMVDADCLHQCMVWNKGQMVLGHSDYHYQHEPILYGWKPGAAHYFTNDRTKTTVFDCKKPNRNAEHPTMKPIELWSEMIINSTQQGAICYDSFAGSGTTMVACHELKRKAYIAELDPKYCQVIVDRMKKLDPALTIKRNGIEI